MIGFTTQHLLATRNLRTPSTGAAAVLLRPFAPTFSNPEPYHRPGRLWSKTFLHPPPSGSSSLALRPGRLRVLCQLDASGQHRSHFGSRYTLGCCGCAGLFCASLCCSGCARTCQGQLSLAALSRAPCGLTRLGAAKSAQPRLYAFRFDLLLHAVGVLRATCCAPDGDAPCHVGKRCDPQTRARLRS